MENFSKVKLKKFDDWNIYEGAAEGSGRSKKVWLQKDGRIGIFKFPKHFIIDGQESEETSTEYSAEKLASIIAGKIDIDCAEVDIGTLNGEIGSMSYKTTKDSETLDEGSRYMPNYNQENLYDSEKEEYYNLQMIENSIKSVVSEVPEKFDDNIMSSNRKELLNLYLNKKIDLLKKIFYGKEN